MSSKDDRVLVGRVVGNTGGHLVSVALVDSFKVKRGGFVRIAHREDNETDSVWVLGRVVQFSRESLIFSSDVGPGIKRVNVPISSENTEKNYASVELIGYRERSTGEIRMPRRPLDPGARVYRVDADFLSLFYEYEPGTSIVLGKLVGYEGEKDKVQIHLDVNSMVTEHVAILAMTGAGKSYTVGRICELLLTKHNASIVILDPHGEYGRALSGGKLNFGQITGFGQSVDSELKKTKNKIEQLMNDGGGIKVFAPETRSNNRRYSERYEPLALPVDGLSLQDMMNLLPTMSPAQRRVMQPALKYWRSKHDRPLYISDLIDTLLTRDGFSSLKEWEVLPEGERKQLRRVSANVIGASLKQLVEAANIFLRRGQEPTRIEDIVGVMGRAGMKNSQGRISIIDISGLSKAAMQAATAILLNEIMESRMSHETNIRPAFVIIEEGHTLAPNTGSSVSNPIIQRVASEGRKFGVGLCIVSQRPSKLHPDVLSQCNTIVTMRIKNPEDQRFIRSSSDYFSEADLNELPSLSTGEALICGRSILAPLIVKVGRKALVHGGESPDVCADWLG